MENNMSALIFTFIGLFGVALASALVDLGKKRILDNPILCLSLIALTLVGILLLVNGL